MQPDQSIMRAIYEKELPEFRRISSGNFIKLRNRRLQRLQASLDFRPSRYQERRQHQAYAQLIERLVDRKAGTVGGNLEQDAVRLAEIE
jgi:hypothetical protein